MATRKPVAVTRMLTDKLHSSGLDAKAGARLQLKPLDTEDAPSWLPFKEAGFVIPYFDINGKPSKFVRWRYLRQPERKGFDKFTSKKALRYVQPKDSENEAYLPPLVDWKAVADDPTQALLITEGELKSAAGTVKTPYPCIGLGGVWSWRSAARHMPALPIFDKFKWNGRPVYIIYDSDAVTNPMVMQAENALARMLTDRGAEPYIVRLPMLEVGVKCGLDDYLLVKTSEDLESLLEGTTTWSSARELHALNEEVVYIRDPGLILRLDNLQKMAPRAFCDHAYSTRIYYEEVVTPKSTKLVPKSAPKEWLMWPARAEVPRMTYAPGDDRITVKGELNVWPGWAKEPKKGDITPWSKLLDHIFAGEPHSRQWFERWCAYPLQFPGTKMFSSAVVWGLKHGTGKSLIGYTLMRIYGRNATEINEEDLRTSHNEWAENKQFVMGDEITGGDKRGTSDRMKSMITQQQLRLNPKYIPSYTVRDCINYYFTSNHPDSFFLEDGDRRFFIHEVTGLPMPAEFYHAYERWMEGDGAAALFHHLLELDMGNFDPRAHAPMTRAKGEMMTSGMSDLAAWVNTLKEAPDTALRVDSTILNYRLWRSEDLLVVYDPDRRGKVTANGLARELSRQGFRKVANGYGVLTQSQGQVRLWAIRDADEMCNFAPARLGEYYDKERGFAPKKPSKGESNASGPKTVQRVSRSVSKPRKF